MDVRVGLWRKLSPKELMLLSCGVGEDSWESLGLQGDPISPFQRRSVLVFFGRNDAKVKTPVLWPPHVKSWLIGKDSDAGRDWGQEQKGMTEDEMAGWHHGLDGREFEWTPGVGDGQGGLACCISWGCKESDMTEWLNWTELNETDSHEIWKVVEKKLGFSGGSAVMQEMEEMQFWSLGWEDPLEKEMTIYSSILAWQIPRTEEPGELQSMGSQRVGQDCVTEKQ